MKAKIRFICIAALTALLSFHFSLFSFSQNIQLDDYKVARVGHPVTVVCVGNSITQGVGASDQKHKSWPGQLVGKLGEGYSVINCGHSGKTLCRDKKVNSYWRSPKYEQALKSGAQILIIALGTNDTNPRYVDHVSAFRADYVKDYLDMVSEFRKDGRDPVIYVALAPPHFPVATSEWNKIIEQELIPKQKEIAEKIGARIIDFHTPLLDKNALFPDNLHPNDEGAGIMASCVADAILKYQNLKGNISATDGKVYDGNDVVVSQGSSVTLSAAAKGNCTYSWTGPERFSAKGASVTLKNIRKGGVYTVYARDKEGNRSVLNFLVSVKGAYTGIITPRLRVNGGDWQEAKSVTVRPGQSLDFSPELKSAPGASWFWQGPQNTRSTERELSIPLMSKDRAGKYYVTYTAADGAQTTLVYDVKVEGEPIRPVLSSHIHYDKSWVKATQMLVGKGETIKLGPQPAEGSWSWTGPDGFVSNNREITISNFSPSKAGKYVATYTNETGISDQLTVTLSYTDSRVQGEDDFPNLRRYAAANAEVMSGPASQRRVVFMGNSITNNWANRRPWFFRNNGYVGRGIGGQTTYHFVKRFKQDVIDLHPEIVVINAATNDVAENSGFKYNEDTSFGNIKQMVEEAQRAGIKVVLTSTLPADHFRWNKQITDAAEKIAKLNKRLEKYAKDNNITYVDYYSKMVNPSTGGMKDGISEDGVHPTAEGYEIMEPIIKNVLDRELKIISSPDSKLRVDLNTSEGLSWRVTREGRPVYDMDNILIRFSKGALDPKGSLLKSISVARKKETVRPVVPMKDSAINSEFTEAVLNYGSFDVVLRVMNDAVAYRFVGRQKGTVEVMNDEFIIHPADGFTAHVQGARSFRTSHEGAYQHKSISKWAKDNELGTVPLLLSADDDTQLLIGECDVEAYPRLFLRATDKGIVPDYSRYYISWEPSGDRSQKNIQEAPYMAKTEGARNYPWRFVAVTDSRGIINQTIPAQLARKNVLKDTSWIRPGKVSWEWWNGNAPFAPEINFKTGCNYETYCYSVDFASKYGIEYILLDEGWAKTTRDPFIGNDNLRLHDLIKYSADRNVKILLWLPWPTVNNTDLDKLFSTYQSWGLGGVKIDFMDRTDQWMVDFYRRVSAAAAKYHLVVDWHGSFTPAGLEQEYPNILSYEGVRGLEQNNNCKVENTMYIPFIRNAVGAADFTPGGFINAQPDRFHTNRPCQLAMGTRCFQMALYVVLESGIQMLADSPTIYYQNDDCTRFISSIPVTWDETRALEARAGDYLIVAKRKGNKWYIGGISNNSDHDFRLKLDFLTPGKYHLTAYQDGVNAGYQAMHYNKVEQDVDNATTIPVHMVRNGGWVAVIE